jgi:hypothetical protein
VTDRVGMKNRRRFEVMHIGKQQLLRRIIGAYPQRLLNLKERELVNDMLSQLDEALAGQEERRGIRIAE